MRPTISLDPSLKQINAIFCSIFILQLNFKSIIASGSLKTSTKWFCHNQIYYLLVDIQNMHIVFTINENNEEKLAKHPINCVECPFLHLPYALHSGSMRQNICAMNSMASSNLDSGKSWMRYSTDLSVCSDFTENVRQTFGYSTTEGRFHFKSTNWTITFNKNLLLMTLFSILSLFLEFKLDPHGLFAQMEMLLLYRFKWNLLVFNEIFPLKISKLMCTMFCTAKNVIYNVPICTSR